MKQDLLHIKTLSRLNPIISLAYIGLEWLMIIGAFVLYLWVESIWLLLILIPFIGTRMYALYSLLHDGTHYLLANNKQINDWIAKLFLAWPLFISLETMRASHFQHHRFMQTEKDPEVQHLQYEEFKFPMTKQKFFGIMLKDLSGYHFLKYKYLSVGKWSWEEIKKNIVHINRYSILFYLMLASVITFLELWIAFIILWIIPFCTVYIALNRLRAYTEHFNIPDNQFNTRSMVLGKVQKFFFCPYNLGFHTEHHLFPNIPNYNLEKLHLYLVKSEKRQIFVSSSLYEAFKSMYCDD
jgi:fatty acid desaturase